MKVQKNNYVKIIKTVNEVETYLAKLKYALSLENTIIEFQESRQADFERNRIFVLSFHFSEWPFEKKDFPFL